MNCCTECFQDKQIRATIKAHNQVGNCDFCQQKNVASYSIEYPSDLLDLISNGINVYEKTDEGEPLFNILIHDN